MCTILAGILEDDHDERKEDKKGSLRVMVIPFAKKWLPVFRIFFGRYSLLMVPQNESGTLAGLQHDQCENSEYFIVEEASPLCLSQYQMYI